MKRTKKRKFLVLCCVFAGTCALIYGAFYEGLVTRRYSIDTGVDGAPVSIALITDLHSCYFGENQAELLRRLQTENPDGIVLAGDIVDDINAPEGALALVRGAALIAPTYYVTGSHDLGNSQIRKILREFEKTGVNVLRGESVVQEINGRSVCLSGIDDATFFGNDQNYLEALEVFTELPRASYHILIAHRPDFIEAYRQYGFDLVLSGHTHGGQARLPPFINGLYAPGQGWFPRYGGGLYSFDSVRMIISRGACRYPDLPRIFNPPELVIVELR